MSLLPSVCIFITIVSFHQLPTDFPLGQRQTTSWATLSTGESVERVIQGGTGALSQTASAISGVPQPPPMIVSENLAGGAATSSSAPVASETGISKLKVL